MILTTDVGNSNIVSIVYDNQGHKLYKDRQVTLKSGTDDDYIQLFKSLQSKISDIQIEKIVLSCVVPQINQQIQNALKRVFSVEVDELIATKVPQLKVALANPNELGADFVATTLGAFSHYDKPVIIVDMGSATKISVVDRQMNFLGAVIQLGIGLTAASLHAGIPHLPPIEIKKPDVILGRSTIECIQSGIVNGAIASVTNLADGIEKEVGEPCARVLTGGYANLFLDNEDFDINLDLLNDGLFYYGRKDYAHEEKSN